MSNLLALNVLKTCPMVCSPVGATLTRRRASYAFRISLHLRRYNHTGIAISEKCFSLVVIAPVLGKISGPTLNEAEYDTKN